MLASQESVRRVSALSRAPSPYCGSLAQLEACWAEGGCWAQTGILLSHEPTSFPPWAWHAMWAMGNWAQGKTNTSHCWGKLSCRGSRPRAGSLSCSSITSPLQYSCLENPMDRGAWQVTVYKVPQSWTQWKWLSKHACNQHDTGWPWPFRVGVGLEYEQIQFLSGSREWSSFGYFQWSCMDVRVGLWRKLSAEELMLLNCGVGEDSWESLGLQGDPTSPFWRRSALGFLWKEWC